MMSSPRAILLEMGASPLRHFTNGPVKKDYVIVPDGLVADQLALARWVGESIVFSVEFPKAARQIGGKG